MGKYLVTGGAGFVGSNLALALANRGDTVLIVDNLSRAGSLQLRNPVFKAALETGKVTFREFDIARDYWSPIFAGQDIDGVFHLAAQLGNQRSQQNPAEDAMSNIIGTIRLLEAVSEAYYLNPHVVMTTSVCARESASEYPFSETTGILPTTPYGMSKLVAAEYCSLFSTLRGVSCGIARLFNVYGPGDIRYPLIESNVIPLWLSDIFVAGTEDIYLYGEDSIRDYIYVDDVVNALLHMMDKRVTDIVNLGTGIGTSNKDLATGLLTAVAQVAPEFENISYLVLESRKWDGDAPRIADISRLRWGLRCPPTTSLTEGLRKTVEWWKTHEKEMQAYWNFGLMN